jgi:hypothetical protein
MQTWAVMERVSILLKQAHIQTLIVIRKEELKKCFIALFLQDLLKYIMVNKPIIQVIEMQQKN